MYNQVVKITGTIFLTKTQLTNNQENIHTPVNHPQGNLAYMNRHLYDLYLNLIPNIAVLC